MSSGDFSDYLTLAQVAGTLGVSPRTMRRWLHEARPGLPHVRVGRRVFVSRADLAEWLARHRVEQNT